CGGRIAHSRAPTECLPLNQVVRNAGQHASQVFWQGEFKKRSGSVFRSQNPPPTPKIRFEETLALTPALSPRRGGSIHSASEFSCSVARHFLMGTYVGLPFLNTTRVFRFAKRLRPPARSHRHHESCRITACHDNRQ